jgi:hypothetical protein
MLYPNCSEWTVRVKILRLDDLTKKELEFMLDYIVDTHGYSNDDEDEPYGEYEEEWYSKIEEELIKLPFWEKIYVDEETRETG